jgi:hypothetical protein
MQTLSSGKPTVTEFVDRFADTGRSTPTFIKILSQQWRGWWDYVHEHTTASKEYKEKIFLLILANAEIADIKAMDGKKNVSLYLSAVQQFGLPTVKLYALLKELGVKVRAIAAGAETSELLDFLSENLLYAINPVMLKTFSTRKVKGTEAINDFETANYYFLHDEELKKILHYVNDNIDEYVEGVYLQLQQNIKDSETGLLLLLNNQDVREENRISIIEKTETKISSLTELSEELWETAIQNNKVVATWENLGLFVAKENGVDEAIIGFVNNPDNTLALAADMKAMMEKPSTDSVEEEDAIAEAVKGILSSAGLSGESFEEIAAQCDYQFNAVPLADMTKDRIVRFIAYNLFDFNPNNFNEIKKTAGDFGIKFIKKNLSDFLKNSEGFHLTSEDFSQLLKLSDLPSSDKLKLIEIINPDLYTDQNSLATDASTAMTDVDASLQFSILLKIIELSKNLEANIKIAIRKMTAADHSITTEILAVLGESFSEIRNRGKRPHIEDTSTNRLFAEKLKEIEYISSYSLTDKGIKINTFKGEGEE